MLHVMLCWIRCLRAFVVPVLLTVALATGAARADLDHGYVRAVFFAPLSLLWVLWPEGGAGNRAVSKFSDILLTLRVEKTGIGLRVTALAFGTDLGERLVRRPLTGYRTVSADRHPLARLHDRLLEQPFVHDLILRGGTADGLAVPAGSRPRAFRSGDPFHGYVGPPVDGRPSLLWKSYGDWVRFIPNDGTWIMLRWREIDGSPTGSASP